MNAKQYEISTRSRYSWTNLHAHNFVTCRKCCTPLLPSEFASGINPLDETKIVVAKLPERCAECETRKRLKQEEKKEAKLAAKEEPKEEEMVLS